MQPNSSFAPAHRAISPTSKINVADNSMMGQVTDESDGTSTDVAYRPAGDKSRLERAVAERPVTFSLIALMAGASAMLVMRALAKKNVKKLRSSWTRK